MAACRVYRMLDKLSSSHSVKAQMKFYENTVRGWFLQPRSQALAALAHLYSMHSRNPVESSDGDCKWKVVVKRNDV